MALLAAAAVATKISPYQQQMWSGGSGSNNTTTAEYRAQGGRDNQLSNPAENAKYFSYSINRSSSAFSSNLFLRSHLSGQLNTEG